MHREGKCSTNVMTFHLALAVQETDHVEGAEVIKGWVERVI